MHQPFRIMHTKNKTWKVYHFLHHARHKNTAFWVSMAGFQSKLEGCCEQNLIEVARISILCDGPNKIFASQGTHNQYTLAHLFPSPLGHLVSWSLGLLVPWSLGPLVPWPLGPLVPWSLGLSVPWSFIPFVHWSLFSLVSGSLFPWFLRPLFP